MTQDERNKLYAARCLLKRKQLSVKPQSFPASVNAR